MAVKCAVCEKTAYPTESKSVDGTTYHTRCFKCKQCGTRLGSGGFAMINKVPYCKPHFAQLFAESGGSYDKAFGDGGRFKKKPTGSAAGASSGFVSKGSSSGASSPTTTTTTTTAAVSKPEPVVAASASTPANEEVVSSMSLADRSKAFSQQTSATTAAPTRSSTSSSSVSSRFASKTPKCHRCNKSAYPKESHTVDGMTYHKACFKCTKCTCKMGMGGFAMINAEPYCKNCFKQMFAESGGSYDKAFGDGGRFKKKPTGSAAGNAAGVAPEDEEVEAAAPKEETVAVAEPEKEVEVEQEKPVEEEVAEPEAEVEAEPEKTEEVVEEVAAEVVEEPAQEEEVVEAGTQE